MELRGDLEVYADAWMELHRARLSGNGPTGIAVSEIACWLDLHGVSEQWEREEFFRFLQVLDSEWLTWARREAERHADAGSGNGRKAGPSGRR